MDEVIQPLEFLPPASPAREEDAVFEALFEHGGSARCIVDPQTGRYLRVNAMMCRMLGYSREELLAFTPDQLTHPDDRAGQNKFFRMGFIEGRSDWEFEKRYIRRDGGTVWVEVNVASVRLAEYGRAVNVCSLIDVTERRREQAELDRRRIDAGFLAEATRLLTATLDPRHVPRELTRAAVPRLADFCFFDVVDGDGVFERRAWYHRDPRWNAVFDEEFGRRPRLKVGTDHPAIRAYRTGHANRTLAMDAAALGRAAADEEHLRLMRALGFHSTLALPIHLGDRIAGVMVFNYSTTRRDHDERDRELAEELCQRAAIALRNADAFTRLADAVAQLERERESRELFISTLSHDLRTPLNAAKVSAQLLVRRPAPAESVAAHATRIVRNVDRCDGMIRDLLDAERIRSGGAMPIRPADGDLVAIVGRALDDLAVVHGPRFELIAPASLPGRWDGEAVQRIIENLCHNAVKYGAAKRPIRVLLHRSAADEDRVVLEVRNEGTPIPEAEQRRLFEHFHRARSAETSGAAGWGIGLTVVLGAARAHGGSVSVESTVEHGTCFRIELPRFAPEAPTDAAD